MLGGAHTMYGRLQVRRPSVAGDVSIPAVGNQRLVGTERYMGSCQVRLIVLQYQNICRYDDVMIFANLTQ